MTNLVHGAEAEATVINLCNVGSSATGYVLLNLPGIGIFAFPPELAAQVAASMLEKVRELTATRQ